MTTRKSRLHALRAPFVLTVATASWGTPGCDAETKQHEPTPAVCPLDYPMGAESCDDVGASCEYIGWGLAECIAGSWVTTDVIHLNPPLPDAGADTTVVPYRPDTPEAGATPETGTPDATDATPIDAGND